MAQMGRPGLSVEQKKDLWKRWKEGQSLSDIGRALGKHPASIHGVVKANGGIVPAERTRSPRVLSLSEREEISRGVARQESVRRIARGIGRAPSTVSREINRHGGRRKYRAVRADDRAWRSARRPKACLLATNAPLQLRARPGRPIVVSSWEETDSPHFATGGQLAADPAGREHRLASMSASFVATKLREEWSPEQISGWLVATYPADDTMRVSPETIYRSLFLQARGVLQKELITHLRRVRSMRSSKHATRNGQNRGGIIDAISIRERPAEVEDRAVPGHWEGDLIRGLGNTYIATLVERHSRFVMLVKVAGKDTDTVVGALTRQVLKLPDELMRSLTWDRGTELAAHKRFTIATDAHVYSATPAARSSEAPTRTPTACCASTSPRAPTSQHTARSTWTTALKLNSRPRKTLGSPPQPISSSKPLR
ncbi:MAG: family transposase [Solirubrobacterales bacterium]|nr:family transposase [Solirubrobacterales bacterium]